MHHPREADAWLHCPDPRDIPSIAAIADVLAQANVRTRAFDSSLPSGPGILLFNEATELLFRFLRDVSHGGLQRILAVAASSAALTKGRSWQLLQAGASDVFAWDSCADPASVVASRLARWKAVDELLNSPRVKNILVGQSPSWICVLRQIVEVAHFTDASMLIMGETGTGKELVAHLTNAVDPKPHKHDLEVVDCTTIVPELSGSEFFGHERGAFTGAVAARDGAFALADGGTLFLDEIGELPPALQAQLLRVVQEHTYKRVGSNTWRETHFRLVCATNRDLLQEVAKGQFRADLYYRVANWTCRLPHLRERTEDIIPLAQHFMYLIQPDKELPKLDQSVQEYLRTREYPGNVRDLKQLVSRMMYRHVGAGPITIGDIPEEERPASEPVQKDWLDDEFERAIQSALTLGLGLRDIRSAAEETAIRIAVSAADGNLRRAAQRLGVTARALELRRKAQRQSEYNPNGDETD